MAKDLLLEIGLEEMPARYVSSSIKQLEEKIEKWFYEHKIAYNVIQSFSTPRRLAILVTDVAEAQEDITEEAKGPAKKIAIDENGNWSKAAIGFTRGHGMTVDDIYFKEIKGVEYAHVKKFTKGKSTFSLLPELKDIIVGLTFPKNMRWANEEIRYIRPIKWLLALFGEEVIPFSIAGVTTGNKTYGHRFLGKEITIKEPKAYEQSLLQEYVIANSQERKEGILSQLKNLEEQKGWTIPVDEDLLDEVNNLVEYPTALYGQFEEEFLSLPAEVLITSMKEHQRYFPVKSKDGDLLPYFVTVRNGDHNHLENVAKGNEKVLRARLADADFFYKEDFKQSIDDNVKKLDHIIYHEDIGTLGEKVRRVQKLANLIGEKIGLSAKEKEQLNRAAEICKFDLVTNMVNEFPELQGIMGEKYALKMGEDVVVAKAINEHYMPRHAGDSVAESNVGAVLAIADKMDTIVSTFAIGIIPSGSQDPYALRRHATGIVQTLLAKDWAIPLEDLLQLSIELVNEAGFRKLTEEELTSELHPFFKLRMKYLLQEKEIRYDIIDAVLADKIGFVSSTVKKGELLNIRKNEAGFKEMIESLSRVINIANKAKDDTNVDETLFENEYEKKLYDRTLEAENYRGEEEYYQYLTSLQGPINDYFEHTMVMVDDERVRNNRLSFMRNLAQIIKKFADTTYLQVK